METGRMKLDERRDDMLQVGKLYHSKTDYFLLYPEKENFDTIFKYLHDHPGGSPYAICHTRYVKDYQGNEVPYGGSPGAQYWSRILNKAVTYCPRGAMFLVLHLEHYDDFRICAKVLVNENIGWIMVEHMFRRDQTVLMELV